MRAGQPMQDCQADGSQHFRATKQGDIYKIEAGHERYEIPEMFVYGG